ncbi:DUF4139 domain-containing protein [Spartinivicinus poritis]|uniref:DUF4139 domain-containing protein n=1 Tax=Spartinivicinus poritis TaxID=2994640 RepID=A0ABT5U3S0_9GAMM|nr:hypothetical protein [Spartinivicinus sp. A2-2]MDE1461015.1 hypothetical protein [Spartinivicinus sp. A2-2]
MTTDVRWALKPIIFSPISFPSIVLSMLLPVVAFQTAAAEEATLDASKEAKSTQLTLYRQATLVKQQFTKSLPKGDYQLLLHNISDQLLLDSLQVQVAGGQINALEMIRKPLTVDEVFKRLVGKPVRVYQAGKYQAKAGKGILQAYSNRLGIVALDHGEQVVVNWKDNNGLRLALPENTLAEASFAPRLSAQVSASQPVESASVQYLTRGLSFNTNYSIQLHPNQTTLDLAVTTVLSNKTNTVYPDAQVTIGVGDVKEPMPRGGRVEMLAQAAPMMDKAVSEPEAVGDVHFYHFNQPLSIPAHSEQQLPLFEKQQVTYSKYYRLNWYAYAFDRNWQPQKENPVTLYRFKTDTPMPGGAVRVFQDDKQGHSRWIGSSQLRDTGANQSVDLQLGTSADIAIKRNRLAYQQLDSNNANISWEVEIHNSKKEAVSLELVANDHSLLEISKITGAKLKGTNTLAIELPAEKTVKVNYTTTHQR